MNKIQLGILSCGIAIGMVVMLPSMQLQLNPLENNTAESDAPTLAATGGVITLVHHDASGNILGTQTTHNQLLDAGEDFILQQVFIDTNTVTADSAQIGSICLSADDTTIVEALTAATFNTNHQADDNVLSNALNCKPVNTVTHASQISEIGPLTFSTGTTSSDNWYSGDIVKQIGICTTNASDHANCQTTLFAAVDISDVTLANGETLTITYTFNMQSGTT